MKKIYLLGLLGCGLLGSCSNEDILNGDQPVKGNYTIEATIGDAQTRTSVDGDFGVQWSTGDKIGVYGGTVANSTEFTLDGEGGTATGQFTGNFEGTPTYAYYPYSAGTTLTDKKLEMTLPASYAYTGDSNGPMIGKYAGNAIAFKHLCGLLKVSINNIPSSATKFVLEASSAIAGKASVADISATDAVLVPSETEAPNVSNTVTVTLSDTATTNKEFYFPLPVGTYESLEVSLQDESGAKLYEKTASDVNIVRAGAVNMPILDASIACLKEIAKNGGSYTLITDMVFSEPLVVESEMTLDLNGCKITPKAGGLNKVLNTSDALVLVRRGAKLTIKDSSIEGDETFGDGSITCYGEENVYAAVKLTDSNDMGDAKAELTVESGLLIGNHAGITGNGNRHGTKITINGGNISAMSTTGDVAGIYHPQDGELTINGGIIQGYTGIEMRAGTLTVNGGDIRGTAKEFSKKSNGGGTTIVGAAIAVSQHTTNKNLKVVIKNGGLSGIYALYEEDLQDEQDTDKISLEANGVFYGAVYSENCKNFIKNAAISDLSVLEYLADEASVTFINDIEVTALYIPEGKSVFMSLCDHKLTIKEEQIPASFIINEKEIENKNVLICGSLTLADGTIENNKKGISLSANGAQVKLSAITYTTNNNEHFGIFNAPNISGTGITILFSDITSSYYAISTNALANPVGNTTITLDNSTFTAKETAMMVNIPSTVTATNCNFTGGWQGVFLRGGTTTFTDCHINLKFANGYATSSKAQGEVWGDGNNAPAAALTMGNRSDSAYDYPTKVTLVNTTFSNSGTDGNHNAENYPAIYIDAEQKANQGVTFTYDTASQTSFEAAGKGLVIQEGAKVTENKP